MTDDYRKQQLEALAKAKANEDSRNVFQMIEKSKTGLESAGSLSPSYVKNDEEFARAFAIVMDREQDATSRLLALESISLDIGDSEEFFDQAIAILSDNSQPAQVRSGILTLFRQASFSSVKYREKRPELFESLRTVFDDQQSSESFRLEVAEFLAVNKDDGIQAILNRGLDDPAQAIMEPENAIRLLGLDIHSVDFKKLRSMLPTADTGTRLAIIRVLSADPESVDALEQIATNASEDESVRSGCIVALSSLDPTRYTQVVEAIVLDEKEPDDLRAIGLGGYRRAEQLAENSGLESMSSGIADKLSGLKSGAKGKLLKAINKYLGEDN